MTQTLGKRAQNVVGQMAIAIVIAVAFVWVMQMGKAPTQILARRDCENRYAQAHTRADTLAVDRFVSPLARGRDSVGGRVAPCGRWASFATRRLTSA